MKRWFLGAVLVILVVAFGFLTQGVHKSSLTEDQETQMAQDAQKAQDEKAKAAAAKVAAVKPVVTSAPSAAPGSDNNSADSPPAEEIVGDPATAKHHIEVGWIYDDTNAVDASKLIAALDEIRTLTRKSGGTASAVLVDLDVPTEDRSPAAQGMVDLGVDVDGSSVYAQNPGDAPPGTLTAALQSAIKPSQP